MIRNFSSDMPSISFEHCYTPVKVAVSRLSARVIMRIHNNRYAAATPSIIDKERKVLQHISLLSSSTDVTKMMNSTSESGNTGAR